MSWSNAEAKHSHEYTCGWCGNLVASAIGYGSKVRHSEDIFICPHCQNPTIFVGIKQVPGVEFGTSVKHLPPDVEALYGEARQCAAAACYTASVLICRKLLMNVAVAQGAATGQTFIAYVEHLANGGYVPPNGRGWVDHIRKKGNEATHEIVLMSSVEAEELISFSEMLLKFIYEFPSRIPQVPAGAP
ncbi:MAG: DUF4145 domain-containing protein [Burkholderiales bacterium]